MILPIHRTRQNHQTTDDSHIKKRTTRGSDLDHRELADMLLETWDIILVSERIPEMAHA
jgi:hypothetical protein